MGIAYNTSIVSNGLVFALDAANSRSYSGSGNTVYELSSGTAGTFWGGSGFSSVNAGSFYLNGNNIIRYEDSVILRPSNFTIIVWAKFNSFDTYDTIITKPQTAAAWTPPYLSYLIRTNTNGTKIEYSLADGSFWPNQVNYTLSTNTWYQFVMSYDGTRIKGYLNNSILVDNSLIINVNYASHPVLIGGSYGAIPYGETISGNIPQVLIYNRALSAAEIKQNYNATKKRYGL
jgi:hypothetical protein